MPPLEAIKAARPYDFVTAKAEALYTGWEKAIQHVLAKWRVVDVEKEFAFPLLNPDTAGVSKTFMEAGKIDGVLQHRENGQFAILEHKTTSDSLESDSTYWGRLSMDSQISKYVLAERHLGRDVSQVIYDVVHKPQQRPSHIPLRDGDGVKIVVDQNGERVRTKDGKKWRESADAALGYELKTRPETPLEFRDRILSIMQASPAEFFVQKEVPRLDTDLLEYMQDAWALSKQILQYRTAKLWPRNPAACTAFNTCEFFSLCQGRASIDGINYRHAKVRHPELKTQPEGIAFLTNSRLSALRKCSRYHFLKYEEPTEAIGGDDEALQIGTLFHIGAETYLRSKLNQ